MKYKLTIFFTLLTLISCKKEETGSQNQNVSLAPGQTCAPGKWIGLTSGINLKVSSDFSVSEKSSIVASFTEWNSRAPAGVTLFQTTAQQAGSQGFTNLSGFRDSEFGIYKKNPWFNDVSSNALAVTQYFGILRSNNGKAYLDLQHADIIFNTEDHTFVNSSGPSADYDFQTVVTHELGHFLGFCHELSSNSIMYPYYTVTNRSLKAFDISELNTRYSQPHAAPQSKKSLNSMKELNIEEGQVVRGVIELNKSGECQHYMNGKLVYKHLLEKKK